MKKHIHVKAPVAPYEALEQLDRRIAMESNFLSNFSQTVSSVVPHLANTTKSFLGKLSFSNPVPAADNVANTEHSKFIHLVREHNYMTLVELPVHVPEGFQGSLAHYATLLESSVQHAARLIAEVINPYNTFLSSLVNANQEAFSSRDPLAFLKKTDAAREMLVAQTAKHFSSSKEASTPYGKVITRNADWAELLSTLRRTQDQSAAIDTQAVQEAVSNCCALLDAVKTTAQSGELDKVSPEVLKSLSSHTLSVAREVEFFSITVNRVNILAQAIEDSIASLTVAIQAQGEKA